MYRASDWIHLKSWWANSVYFSFPGSVQQLIYGSIIYVLTAVLVFVYLRLSHASQCVRGSVFWEYQWDWRIYTKGGGSQIDGGKWNPSNAIWLRLFELIFNIHFFPLWRCGPTPARASSFLRFLDHTQRRITVGRTPLDEWSACRRDLYLTTHNNHNRQTSMHPVGFEPAISAGERPQTYALYRAVTGTGICNIHGSFYLG